jgi:hypothetical protein
MLKKEKIKKMNNNFDLYSLTDQNKFSLLLLLSVYDTEEGKRMFKKEHKLLQVVLQSSLSHLT